MINPKSVCTLLGFVFLLLGIAYTFNPIGMFASTGETLGIAAAITDIRAVYGGMEIGIGLYLLWQCRRATCLLSELRLVMFIFGALLFSRTVGIILDEGNQTFNYVIIVVEIACFSLASFAFHKAPKTEID